MEDCSVHPLDPFIKRWSVTLAQIGRPMTAQQLAGQFKRARVKRVEELLETLASLDQARRDNNGLYVV